MRHFLLCFLLLSCSKDPSKEEPGPVPTSTPTPAPNPKLPCAGFANTSQYKSNKTFDLSKTFVGVKYGGTEEHSLCDVLKESKAKIVVMQFSGVFCLSCQDQATDFTKRLSPEVKHAVVFLDGVGDSSESDFDQFMQAYAPKSLKKFNSSKSLYRMLNGSSDIKFGSALAFNGLGDIYFQVNAEKDGLEQFLSELKKL